MAANKIHHFQNYFSGDPYVGLRTTEMKQKNDTISMLEKENKQLKNRITQLEARYALFSVIMFMMTIWSLCFQAWKWAILTLLCSKQALNNQIFIQEWIPETWSIRKSQQQRWGLWQWHQPVRGWWRQRHGITDWGREKTTVSFHRGHKLEWMSSFLNDRLYS